MMMAIEMVNHVACNKCSQRTSSIHKLPKRSTSTQVVSIYTSAGRCIRPPAFFHTASGRFSKSHARRQCKAGAVPGLVLASVMEQPPLGDGLLKAYNALAEGGLQENLPRDAPMADQLASKTDELFKAYTAMSQPKADELIKAYAAMSQPSIDDGGGEGLVPSIVSGALQSLTALSQETAREADLVQERFGPAVTFLTRPLVRMLSPFQVFDAWLLNILLLTAIGILVYNLLVLAPRQ